MLLLQQILWTELIQLNRLHCPMHVPPPDASNSLPDEHLRISCIEKKLSMMIWIMSDTNVKIEVFCYIANWGDSLEFRQSDIQAYLVVTDNSCLRFRQNVQVFEDQTRQIEFKSHQSLVQLWQFLSIQTNKVVYHGFYVMRRQVYTKLGGLSFRFWTFLSGFLNGNITLTWDYLFSGEPDFPRVAMVVRCRKNVD